MSTPFAMEIVTEFELSGSEVCASSPLMLTMILFDRVIMPCCETTVNIGFMAREILPAPACSFSKEVPDMETPGSIMV